MIFKRLFTNWLRRNKPQPSGTSRGGSSSGHTHSLPIEVSACLPAFDLLGKQIVSVAEKGNESTEALAQSFGDMATQANELVQRVTAGPRDDSGIESAEAVLSLLLSKFQESNRATAETNETLSLIERELKNVEACASQVEDISRRARLVSFNGRIEAQRAGEQGKGFAVVAEETGKLAMTVAKTSREIGEAVGRLTSTLRTTSEEMRTLVERGNAAAGECEQNVNDTLQQLVNYQSQLEQELASVKTTGDSLSGAISRSIMGLQFQDAVSQRMHHVSDSLEAMRLHFSEMVPTNNTTDQRSQFWIEKIAESYCVAEEHIVHAGDADETAEPDMSNIELF